MDWHYFKYPKYIFMCSILEWKLSIFMTSIAFIEFFKRYRFVQSFICPKVSLSDRSFVQKWGHLDIIAIDYGAIRSRFVCDASMQMGFDWILAGLKKSLPLLLMIFRLRIQVFVVLR